MLVSRSDHYHRDRQAMAESASCSLSNVSPTGTCHTHLRTAVWCVPATAADLGVGDKSGWPGSRQYGPASPFQEKSAGLWSVLALRN